MVWNKYIEVNLSGTQSMDEKLPETLLQITEKYQVEPGFINLEITETAAVHAGARLFSNMKKLRQAGCHFSMDDFGTGYSNLSQVAEINFELIKLDKSLLWPCFEEKGEKAEVILKACIDMIHRLGCSIVAEGVETEEQMKLLMAQKVEYLQGYYYARSMPETNYMEFLMKNEENR